MYYYIADTHFGHRNIIEYDRRPFESVIEMDETMIDRWNSRVTDSDTVFVIGDISRYRNKNIAGIVDSLNGRLILIRGNHDTQQICDAVVERFGKIFDYLEIDDGGTRVIMSHYPMPFWNCDFEDENTEIGHIPAVHLYGHVHNNPEWQILESFKSETGAVNRAYRRMANVGCMLPYMDYTPRTLDEIITAHNNFI